MKTITSLGLTLALVLAQNVSAGTIVKMKSSNDGEQSNNLTMYQDGKLRVDNGTGEDKTSMLYDANANRLYMLNHVEKSYMVFDEKTIGLMIGKMQAAQKQMEASIANMPKEQQEMMRNMMGGGKKGPKPHFSAEKSGKSANAAGIDCEQIVIKKNGKLHNELCVADLSDIPNGAEMMSTFKKMMSLFSKYLEAMPMIGDEAQEGKILFDLISGFPIMTQDYNDEGEKGDSGQLESLTDVKIESSQFELPQNYKAMDMNTAFGNRAN